MFIVPLFPALITNRFLADWTSHSRGSAPLLPLLCHRFSSQLFSVSHATILSALATAVDVSTGASSSAAAAHWRPRWTSPRARPSLPLTTMPLALSSLRPRPMTKKAYAGASVVFEGVCVSAFADGAGESATASALLPPRCCRRAVLRRRASRCRHRR